MYNNSLNATPERPNNINFFLPLIKNKNSVNTTTSELLNCFEKYITPNNKNILQSRPFGLFVLLIAVIIKIAVNKLTNPSDINEVENKNCKKLLFNKSNENKPTEIILWKLERFNSIKNNNDK